MLSYEELTFPEVEALPRDLPLVIPLGNRQEYSDEGLRSALGLSEWCWMPSVPYGFPSPDPVLGALAVAPQVLERLLGSLLAILAEDGFTRVHLVSCHGPAGSLPVVSVPGRPGAWPPCPPAGRVALISTGHTEQHGLHLPLATDTLIIEALAARVEGLRPHRVWRLPPWPYGVSTHRRQYPGTLSADPRAWEDFWVEVVGCLYRMGFRCVYLINGHGGNHSFLVNAVKFCGERWPDAFVATSFLHTSSG
ncbi:MAG TPA: creatininase family protein, partial [Candidatus Nitrosotenuis sp.]|nr:creatininase family protein [Candidatus Nitrosotenuis sp.]